MNLETALRQSNNDAWIARKFGMQIEGVREARREAKGLRSEEAVETYEPIDTDGKTQAEQEWEIRTIKASARLRDAIRAYRYDIDWAAWDEREADRAAKADPRGP